MEKFIPYEKLSKKEKRKIDQAKRQTWGELNPVTRKPANSKAYNRSKARDWKRAYHEPTSGILIYTSSSRPKYICSHKPGASICSAIFSPSNRSSVTVPIMRI